MAVDESVEMATAKNGEHVGSPGQGARALRTIGLVLGALVVGVLVAQFLPSDLLGLRGGTASTAAVEQEAASQLWTCGMHPQVLEEEAGQCPICGMNLTPLRTDQAGASGAVEAGGEMPMADGRAMNARPVVRIDPAVVQNMNVRTETAVRRDLTQPIRTVGYLEYDQERMVTVTTKYAGWVEKVYVNYVGEKVRRGEPLFEIYAPELVQTEQELLSALEFAAELHAAPADAQQRARSMVESARVRLGYWDVSPQQIARLEETAEVFRTLTVAAPADGLVMKRMVGLEGMAVQPGMEIFHIANLSSLWLSVELFEDQVAWVGEGTPATISLSYFPGETFHGHVRFLEPELSEQTRTVRAQIEVPNPGGHLRKGMYATVELAPVVVRDAVTVPLQAVLRTGQRNLVVRALGEGRFVPQEVAVGHEAAGYAEILAGLEEGDEIVTSAHFLLDSESKLRAAVRTMAGSGGAAQVEGSSMRVEVEGGDHAHHH